MKKGNEIINLIVTDLINRKSMTPFEYKGKARACIRYIIV